MGILRDFARGTSIHGLGFIVEPKLPKITRVIWTLLFIGAMIYATLELRKAVICKLIILSKKIEIHYVMPCPFTGPKIFWVAPRFLCRTKNLLHIVPVTNILCQTKR